MNLIYFPDERLLSTQFFRWVFVAYVENKIATGFKRRKTIDEAKSYTILNKLNPTRGQDELDIFSWWTFIINAIFEILLLTLTIILS